MLYLLRTEQLNVKRKNDAKLQRSESSWSVRQSAIMVSLLSTPGLCEPRFQNNSPFTISFHSWCPPYFWRVCFCCCFHGIYGLCFDVFTNVITLFFPLPIEENNYEELRGNNPQVKQRNRDYPDWSIRNDAGGFSLKKSHC